MPEMRTHLSKIEDYPAFLEACWQEHLKPKAEDAPTVISLFAGEFEEGIKQIGNCAPPLFMRAIAHRIRQNLLAECARSAAARLLRRLLERWLGASVNILSMPNLNNYHDYFPVIYFINDPIASLPHPISFLT
jgi:hypothetical protein